MARKLRSDFKNSDHERKSRRQIVDQMVETANTTKVVYDILCKWPVGKIVRFKNWMTENANSDNVPWNEV